MAGQRRHTPLARSCTEPHACPRPLRLEVLGRSRFFAGLATDEIAAIDRRMQVRGYQQGEAVYRTGDAAGELFVLASGRVKLTRYSLDGQDVLVDVVPPGGLFGTLAMLGEPTYPDSAHALTVCCALRISADQFRAVLRDHPPIAFAVLDDLAARLEQAQESLRRISGGSVQQRVAATLLALADRLGQPHRDGGTLVQLPLTRADLAAMTGTTTESVSRALSRLRRDGIIDTGRRWTAVTDRARLAALAAGSDAADHPAGSDAADHPAGSGAADHPAGAG